MRVESLIELIGADFYTGVPDSQLKALCDFLYLTYGIDRVHHIIAANEGNCVAIAAGYHLATGKIPVVYLQNSGLGNIANPVMSLTNNQVYGIPMMFIIGWRGEPGVHDEPQHIFQGAVTLKLLEDMDVQYFVLGKETAYADLKRYIEVCQALFDKGKSAAIVVQKDVLTYDKKPVYQNNNELTREEAIGQIVRFAGDDLIVSTTGKASRELFEIREKNGQAHNKDFLTVGSMGHSSSIALGIALNKPDKRVWCIDGDGAFLMHMGAVAVIGANSPKNMVHIVINNGSHESVGGLPTVADITDLISVAKACGYKYAVSVSDLKALISELGIVKTKDCLCFLEIKCSIGARGDLGRPTVSPTANKNAFMKRIIVTAGGFCPEIAGQRASDFYPAGCSPLSAECTK